MAHLPTYLLRPSLLELYLVHGPHSPLNVLYSHKTLVKAKIMPDRVLQRGREETRCMSEHGGGGSDMEGGGDPAIGMMLGGGGQPFPATGAVAPRQ